MENSNIEPKMVCFKINLQKAFSIANTPIQEDLLKLMNNEYIQYENEYSEIIEQRSEQNPFIDLIDNAINQVRYIDDSLSVDSMLIHNKPVKITDQKIKKSIKRPKQILSIYSDKDIRNWEYILIIFENAILKTMLIKFYYCMIRLH